MKKLAFVFSMALLLGSTSMATAENEKIKDERKTCCLQATITDDEGETEVVVNGCAETCKEAWKDVEDTLALYGEE